MKQQPIISARVRLTRLQEQVPDKWLEALVPFMIVLVACLRRFFAASGETPLAAWHARSGNWDAD